MSLRRLVLTSSVLALALGCMAATFTGQDDPFTKQRAAPRSRPLGRQSARARRRLPVLA